MTLAEALSKTEYRTKRQLAELMHCTPREVEFQVERARKSAQLAILSGPDGYRMARNPEEFELNIARRHKRALVQLVTTQGEKAYLERWRAQLNPPAPQPKQEALW